MKKETKKSNRKPSPNKLTCNISGAKRISNRKYLAAKAEKLGTDVETYKSNYVCKAEYAKLVSDISEFGFSSTANERGVTNNQLKLWLRYNGRGGFVKVANAHEKKWASVDNVAVAA